MHDTLANMLFESAPPGPNSGVLVDASPVGHMLLDGELRVVTMNPAAAALGPLAAGAAHGRLFADVLPELAGMVGVLRGVPDTQLSFLNMELHIGVAERRRHLLVSGFPVAAPSGTLIGVMLVDLPESVAAGTASRDRDALFRTAFERAAIGMLVIDWRDHGMRTNAALQQFLGYTGDELAQIGVRGFTHPDDFAVDLELFQRLMAGEIDHYRLAKRYLCKGGEVVWADLVVSLARDAAGQPELIISMMQDITERKRAEAERDQLLVERTHLLHEAQEGVRVRDVFLAMAAHELKTPLTPMKMEIERMLLATVAGSVRDPERARTSLVRVERQIGRLERLVNDLLDVSSIAAGRLELVRERVDLADATREVVARHHQQAHWSGYQLTTRADQPVLGWWDRARLEQVVTNLVSNALKFGEGRPIEVAVEADDAVARFTVRDQGVGIPAEFHERIFEKFERVHSDRRHAGLGLGLWICRHIVTALGGRLSVVSAPGLGSTFMVELPRGGGS
jgi:PAS domain S-box-containing protein